MYTISELLWLKPTRHHISENYLKYLPFQHFWLHRWLNRLAHAFSTLPHNSSLPGWHRLLGFSTWIATNWPTCIQGYSRRHRRWLPATWDWTVIFDLRSRVADDRPTCGVHRSLVCKSVSLLQFTSRNQLVRSVSLTVHSSVWVSKQCTNLYKKSCARQTQELSYTWGLFGSNKNYLDIGSNNI